MRLHRAWPLVALLIAGCDPQLVQVLGDLAGPVAGAPSTGTGAGPVTASTTAPAMPTPSPSPIREAYAALDLSAQTWVPEQPETFRVEGDQILVPARAIDRAYLIYRPALGDTFTLSFTEKRASVNGDLTVWWMLDRADVLKQDASGQNLPNGEHKLNLFTDGRCQLNGAGKTHVDRKVTGPRAWTIAVRPGRTTVTLNGDVFAEYDHAPGYHPAPFLAFSTRQRKKADMLIEDVRVTSNAPGPRHAVLRQWSLAGKGAGVERFNLLYASDMPQMPAPAELDTLPAMLPHVVAVGGYPLYRAEAFVVARTDGFSGGTHNGGTWVSLSPRLCKALPISAHEISHGYNAAGSQKARSGEGWLVEGFADYLCYVAHNRYTQAPEWKAPASSSKVHPYDPLLSEPNDVTTARDGKDAVSWKVYSKGRLFLTLLAAHTSHEDVRATVIAAKDIDRLTGERFVQLLEARTGKDLSALLPGWLTPGPYRGATPKDGADTDKDGLLDLQEMAWNTDPTKKDTDSDGVSDYDEKLRGTDPRVAGAPIPGLSGFAPGMPAPALPDVVETNVETPVEPEAPEAAPDR